MNFHIFQKTTNQTCGPYTLEQIQTYLDQGLLSIDDSAAQVGSAEWVPITTVNGLVFSKGKKSTPKLRETIRAPSNQRQSLEFSNPSIQSQISFERATQAPFGLMMTISLSSLPLAAFLFYVLMDSSPFILGLAFVTAFIIAFLALRSVRNKLRNERINALVRMENEFEERFGSSTSWRELIGGFLQEGGDEWAEGSLEEFNLVGTALGKAVSFLGGLISDTPKNREKEFFARRIQLVEHAIERNETHFFQAIVLILLGFSLAMFAIINLP